MPEPIIYKKDPPAPKQVKFPNRRHNTRSGGAARNLPQKLKRQSTLTQLDFVSTPHGSDEVIIKSSDEDEEYSERKPKKRRRKLDRKDRDQSTLTQNWRLAMDQHSSSGEWEADWEEDTTIMETTNESKAQDTQGVGKYLYGRMQEVSSEVPEVGDSQSEASSPPRKHRMLVASSDPGGGSTRPTTSDSKANPKTPKNVRRTEIPSSQTPSSAILSVQQSRRARDYDDLSPLKGRYGTPTPVLKKSSRSQTSSPSKRMLKHMESEVPSLEKLAPGGDSKAGPWKAEIVSSPRHKQMPAPAVRRLVRATTVQDSQDDVGLMELPESELPGRSLKRVSTVSDSQGESDLDIVESDEDQDGTELPAVLDAPEKEQQETIETAPVPEDDTTQPGQQSLQNNHNDANMNWNTQGEGFSHEYNYMASLQQQTFDPVSAALDRDAARFGRGYTQRVTQIPTEAEADLVMSDDEERSRRLESGQEAERNADVVMHDLAELIEDSEPEYVAESPVEADPETQFIADSPSAEGHCDPSQELGNFTQASTHPNNGKDEHHMRAAAAIDYPQSIGMIPDVEGLGLPMPASPNLPRPSQVSTVVSTQMTTSRPNSGHGNAPKSPQKSTAWANTFSSSPFPLPPESWRGAQSYRDLETQSSDIFDFSLPPPPPLLSSARQTPASSSR